jgi:hypothetical protein
VRWLCVSLLVPAALAAQERWIVVKSGPFEVYSEAGDRPARERLNDLEQFREAFANVIGKRDLKLVWPLRLLIFKKQPPVAAGKIALGRDAYIVALAENSATPPEMMKQLARLLLDQNTSRMPDAIETGLIELFSTLQIAGTKVTLGTPVPAAERSRDWARMQMLTIDPAFSGRTRVMLSNLAQSPDMMAACRNAYEKTPAQIEKQLDDYIKAGNYGTGDVSGRALSAARDFHPVALESDASRLAQADLLLAFEQFSPAGRAYAGLKGAEAAEGLGIIALRDGKKDEALKSFASAADAASKSARLYLNLGLLETDNMKARANLRKAAELNPNWGEPWRLHASSDPTPELKITDLKKAAALDPRNSEYWQELAKIATDANQFSDAAKAWAGAERAAVDDQERERIRGVRLGMEGQRSDFEAAERKRLADEQAAEVERVKQQGMAEIHAAEDAARKTLNPNGEAVPKATVWIEELNGTGKASGMLVRFECRARQNRLVIQTEDGKTIQLAVRDASHIGIPEGEKMVPCGEQTPPRRVVVQYVPQPDKRLGTAGDATVIEFR